MEIFTNLKQNTVLQAAGMVAVLVVALGLLGATPALADEGIEVVSATVPAEEIQPFITDVRVEDVDTPAGTAHVLWNTDFPVQGMVVCGLDWKAPYTFDRNTENFGYEWSTAIIRGDKVLAHDIPLESLAPGIHYCRAAVREGEGSQWVVSEEVTFDVEVGNPVLEGNVLPVIEVEETGVTGEGGSEAAEAGAEVAEEEESNGAAAALFSLGDAFRGEDCGDSWSVWMLIILALLFAATWSKEMLAGSIPTHDSVKRLYALSGAGVVLFLIALVNSAASWIVPVGVGTMVLIIATIADVVRNDDAKPNDRLTRVMKALIISLVVALVMAFVLGWNCSVVPVIVAIVVLMIRYSLHKNAVKKEGK